MLGGFANVDTLDTNRRSAVGAKAIYVAKALHLESLTEIVE